MTAHQYIGLAARLLAIWLAVLAIQAVGIAQALSGQAAASATWVPYAFTLVYLVVALLLWFFPMSIAGALLPRTRFEDQLKLPPAKALAVASIIIGLVVIVFRALPGLVSYLSVAALWIANAQPVSTMPSERHIEVIVSLAELVAGAYLITRAHRVAERVAAMPPMQGEA